MLFTPKKLNLSLIAESARAKCQRNTMTPRHITRVIQGGNLLFYVMASLVTLQQFSILLITYWLLADVQSFVKDPTSKRK